MPTSVPLTLDVTNISPYRNGRLFPYTTTISNAAGSITQCKASCTWRVNLRTLLGALYDQHDLFRIRLVQFDCITPTGGGSRACDPFANRFNTSYQLLQVSLDGLAFASSAYHQPHNTHIQTARMGCIALTARNLIRNGDFNEGMTAYPIPTGLTTTPYLTSWTTTTGVFWGHDLYGAGLPNNAQASVFMRHAVNAGLGDFIQTDPMTFIGGQEYTIEFDAYAVNLIPESMALFVGLVQVNVGWIEPPITTWTHYTFTYTPPANITTYVNMICNRYGADGRFTMGIIVTNVTMRLSTTLLVDLADQYRVNVLRDTGGVLFRKSSPEVELRLQLASVDSGLEVAPTSVFPDYRAVVPDYIAKFSIETV